MPENANKLNQYLIFFVFVVSYLIIGGDEVAHGKPAPDIFLKACEEIESVPEMTYAIEDSYNGIRAASTGKLRPIMVPDLLPSTEEMEEISEVILEDLLEVIKYL